MRGPLMSFAVAPFFKLKVFNIPTPFLVYWSLTDRCNLSCKYCFFSRRGSDELTTVQISALIDEMAAMGTKRIVFTGGEALLRDDIGGIVEYAFKRKIRSVIISNGILVPKKIKELKNLDMFVFSLDGPPDINDYLRGGGSYKHLMQAIDASRRYNLSINLIAVLSRYNVDSIDYLIKEAQRLKTTIGFHPVLEDMQQHSNAELIPSIEAYRQAISKIISCKKKDNGVIRNSLTGLRYLLHWPCHQPIQCSGGLLSCRIDTNGDVGYCSVKQRVSGSNCIDVGFKRAFRNLVPITCYGCYCGMKIELNYLLKLDINCIMNFIKIYKKYS